MDYNYFANCNKELMNKLCLLTALFLLCTSCAWAQTDSATLVNAAWQVDSLDGMVLKKVHFTHHEYFNSNQFIAILEIPAQSDKRLAFAYEPERTPTSVIAQRHDAVAAINGSFFDMDKHHPVCYLRIDGEELGENTPGTDTVNRKYYQYGTLVLREGAPHILRTDSARTWERSLPDSNVMTAGPLLILRGETQPFRHDRTFVSNRHPRTAVGIRPDGTTLLFVVDGRTKESEGMSLDELTSTLHWLGCKDALNMDGGGSTTLYIKGKPYDGIVNYPINNGRFDHTGERGVSNAILVVKNR